MNVLSRSKRAAIIRCLVEGNSIRSTCRITGAAKKTVLRLLLDAGAASVRLHNRFVHDIRTKYVEVDEIWTYVGIKDANIPEDRRDEPGRGSVWTWVAMDRKTKLVITWHVGDRDEAAAQAFLRDLRARTVGRFQLSSDAFYPYPTQVEQVFDGSVDYGQVQKIYERGEEEGSIRPRCIGSKKQAISGSPQVGMISTSHVERQNLTMRMSIRRFGRRTNAFSKKLQNLRAAVALHYAYYNFARVHQTLRITPAMKAGLTDRLWDLESLAMLFGTRPPPDGHQISK